MQGLGRGDSDAAEPRAAAAHSQRNPTMGMLVADARGVLDATTVAVIAVPVLIGLATITGLFLIPQLPEPETVPFV